MAEHDHKAERRRAKSAAARKQAKHADRRRRTIRIGAIVLGIAALIVGLTVAVVTADYGQAENTGAKQIPSQPARTAVGRETAPPWDAPDHPVAHVAAAGLPMLGAEGTVEHIHAKLNVIVNGNPVAVPAEIGIDQASQRLSPLHTHDTTGVIHVESPVPATFTLGQFMTEWDVSLDAQHIGNLTATNGNALHWYVNGQEQTGDPAAHELKAHDVITIVYGPTDQHVDVPSTYDWPADL
ncbi:hypothetical protein ACPA54_05935 [Uniformispora flossi]|uniref:hypothetical protein n=1 Tax=Uniformispora flossi TaxID=3390723 RepID=UPI003C2C72A5